MTNEERKIHYMKRNVKMYPALCALTWEVFFVWTISTMFYTQVKGLTYSQTASLDSVLMLTSCICCYLVLKFFKKVTPINSMRISLVGYLAFVLICIFGQGYIMMMLANICLGIGYAAGMTKGNFVITEPLSILKRDNEYSKIYGKGLSIYYIAEAICSVAATYLFSWNPYASYWFAAAIIVFALLYSLLYKEPSKFQDSNVEIDNTKPKDKVKTKSKKFSLKSISLFVVYIVIFSFMFRGVLGVTSSMFRIYLQEATGTGIIPVWLFGYIYAISRLCVALSTKFQFKFNLKFGVRTLILFYVLTIIGFVANGLMYILLPLNIGTVIITILLSFILSALRAPGNIFLNNYTQICTRKNNVENVYAYKSIAEYLGHSVGALLISFALNITCGNYGMSMLIFIGIMAVPFAISLFLFIRELCKKYAQKYTIIKEEYTED